MQSLPLHGFWSTRPPDVPVVFATFQNIAKHLSASVQLDRALHHGSSCRDLSRSDAPLEDRCGGALRLTRQSGPSRLAWTWSSLRRIQVRAPECFRNLAGRTAWRLLVSGAVRARERLRVPHPCSRSTRTAMAGHLCWLGPSSGSEFLEVGGALLGDRVRIEAGVAHRAMSLSNVWTAMDLCARRARRTVRWRGTVRLPC